MFELSFNLREHNVRKEDISVRCWDRVERIDHLAGEVLVWMQVTLVQSLTPHIGPWAKSGAIPYS